MRIFTYRKRERAREKVKWNSLVDSTLCCAVIQLCKLACIVFDIIDGHTHKTCVRVILHLQWWFITYQHFIALQRSYKVGSFKNPTMFTMFYPSVEMCGKGKGLLSAHAFLQGEHALANGTAHDHSQHQLGSNPWVTRLWNNRNR